MFIVIITSALLLGTLVGCTSTPARWAVELRDTVRCDMRVSEVEAISAAPITAREYPSALRGTHFAEKDAFGSYVRFWFEEEQLKAVQTMKEYFLMRVAAGPKKELCEAPDKIEHNKRLQSTQLPATREFGR